MYLYPVMCCFLNIQRYVCIYTQRHEYVSTHACMQTLDIYVYTDEIRASADRICIPFTAENPLCRS